MIAVVVRAALAFLLALLTAGPASAQVFQSGTVIPQHMMMWGGSNTAQDAGGSAPLLQGFQPYELGLVAAPNSTGSPFPAVATGHGPNGENSCLYDSPLGTGGHYLCFSANLGSNVGTISFGSISGGATGSLQFLVNGTRIPCCASTGNVSGPGVSTVGDLLSWNNTLGTLVADTGIQAGAVLTTTVAAATYAPLSSPALTGGPTAPTQLTADNSTKIATTAYVKNQGYLTSLSVPVPAPQGRLTLTSHTPVMTANALSTVSVLYDSYVGATVPVFNGSTDTLLTIPGNEATLTLTGSEEAVGFIFDVFAINVSGTMTLCTPTNNGGAAGKGWAGDSGGTNTNRGSTYSALDNHTRAYVTNGGTIANCFNNVTNYGPIAANLATYLGSYFTSGAGTTSFTLGGTGSGGTAAQVFLWNYYNRVAGNFISTDTGAPYTYTSSTPREARASTGNQLTFITGVAEDPISVQVQCQPTLVAAANATAICTPNLDSQITGSNATFLVFTGGAVAAQGQGGTTLTLGPQLGVHFIARNERSDNVNANTFDTNSGEFIASLLKF